MNSGFEIDRESWAKWLKMLFENSTDNSCEVKAVVLGVRNNSDYLNGFREEISLEMTPVILRVHVARVLSQ